ncbi:hypothetical protein MVES_000058 [Malassezia vespertilionis]|uniref:Uncharacterized protein n=1 Tax=Malassezia vespertilionis TaxID=2020962 RepID=A0A2N1JFT1_9BASI|nr:hypothetical protein MVES_000058 [Malassezia vespertilionis]
MTDRMRTSHDDGTENSVALLSASKPDLFVSASERIRADARAKAWAFKDRDAELFASPPRLRSSAADSDSDDSVLFSNVDAAWDAKDTSEPLQHDLECSPKRVSHELLPKGFSTHSDVDTKEDLPSPLKRPRRAAARELASYKVKLSLTKPKQDRALQRTLGTPLPLTKPRERVEANKIRLLLRQKNASVRKGLNTAALEEADAWVRDMEQGTLGALTNSAPNYAADGRKALQLVSNTLSNTQTSKEVIRLLERDAVHLGKEVHEPLDWNPFWRKSGNQAQEVKFCEEHPMYAIEKFAAHDPALLTKVFSMHGYTTYEAPFAHPLALWLLQRICGDNPAKRNSAQCMLLQMTLSQRFTAFSSLEAALRTYLLSIGASPTLQTTPHIPKDLFVLPSTCAMQRLWDALIGIPWPAAQADSVFPLLVSFSAYTPLQQTVEREQALERLLHLANDTARIYAQLVQAALPMHPVYQVAMAASVPGASFEAQKLRACLAYQILTKRTGQMDLDALLALFQGKDPLFPIHCADKDACDFRILDAHI